MRILFCIPYAGASASIYRHWNNRIPDTVCIPLELKGRGSRWSEPFYTVFEEAIEDLLSTITPYISPANRIGLFGHSMGALLAYELALALQAQGKEIDQLFLSGRSCPQLDSNKEADHLLEDDLFVRKITSYGAAESEYLQDPTYREFFLPILRNDFFIIYDHKIKQAPPRITCPVHILYGTYDQSTLGDLKNWNKYTTALPEYTEFQGGHFFIKEFEEEVLHLIHNQMTVDY